MKKLELPLHTEWLILWGVIALGILAVLFYRHGAIRQTLEVCLWLLVVHAFSMLFSGRMRAVERITHSPLGLVVSLGFRTVSSVTLSDAFIEEAAGFHPEREIYNIDVSVLSAALGGFRKIIQLNLDHVAVLRMRCRGYVEATHKYLRTFAALWIVSTYVMATVPWRSSIMIPAISGALLAAWSCTPSRNTPSDYILHESDASEIGHIHVYERYPATKEEQVPYRCRCGSEVLELEIHTPRD